MCKAYLEDQIFLGTRDRKDKQSVVPLVAAKAVLCTSDSQSGPRPASHHHQLLRPAVSGALPTLPEAEILGMEPAICSHEPSRSFTHSRRHEDPCF